MFEYCGSSRVPLAEGLYPDRCKECNGLGQFRWWDAEHSLVCSAKCRYCFDEDLHPLTLQPVKRDGLEDDFCWEPPIEVINASAPQIWRYLYTLPVDVYFLHLGDGEYRSRLFRFNW